MEQTLYNWREHQEKENLKEEDILNIVLQVLEHTEEWDEISPYSIIMETLDNGSVKIKGSLVTAKKTEECVRYLENVSDITAIYNKHAAKVAGEKWFQFVFLIYYLAVGTEKRMEQKQFHLWTEQIEMRGVFQLKIGEDTSYPFLGKFLGKIMEGSNQDRVERKKITKWIAEKYKPRYKIICYSDITEQMISDIESVSAAYDGCMSETSAVTLEEMEQSLYFLIHFDRIQQLQEVKGYYLVAEFVGKNYLVSGEEQTCKCILCPTHWKEYRKEVWEDDYVGISHKNDLELKKVTLKPKEIAEVMEAYFEAYKELKRYLLIYVDWNGQGVIAYFDNRRLRRNQVQRWSYEELSLNESLQDEMAYMGVKDEEIDSICLAASDKTTLMKVMKSIWDMYQNEKDIRFTRLTSVLENSRVYLNEMQQQLYQYYDLCFWSKDVWGRDVLHGVMKKQEEAEHKIVRQIGQTDNDEISLSFYYTSDMETCSFSYVQGKRKAFTVLVSIGFYRGKITVICRRDADGKYDVAAYTDKDELLEARIMYG